MVTSLLRLLAIGAGSLDPRLVAVVAIAVVIAVVIVITVVVKVHIHRASSHVLAFASVRILISLHGSTLSVEAPRVFWIFRRASN